MKKARHFEPLVTYLDQNGAEREESFPVQAGDYSTAKAIACAYAFEFLRLFDFDLQLINRETTTSSNSPEWPGSYRSIFYLAA